MIEEYFKPEQLLKGETYSIRSGLGGSWSVEFVGRVDGTYKFVRHARPDWPRAEFTFRHEEIVLSVYVMCHNAPGLRTIVHGHPAESRRRTTVVLDRLKRRGAGERIIVDNETRWLSNDNTNWRE